MAKKAEGWLRKKTYADGETWLFCYYVTRTADNKRVERSQRVGLVKDFPTERKALVEVERRGLTKIIDNPISINPTFAEIANHWRRHELRKQGQIGRKADETAARDEHLLDRHVLPRWGSTLTSKMSPTEIETWFEVLASIPGERGKALEWTSISKIKSCMSQVFAHGQRNGLIPATMDANPFRPSKLGGVRCKSTSSYEATVVSPEQMIQILDYLDTPETLAEWMMALLHAATALRPEEAFGLKWSDIAWNKGEILIQRGWSKGKETDGKNDHSMVPVAMHPALAAYLQQWREQSLYSKDSDWVFPSLKLKGRKPRTASIAAQDYLRPAAVKTGVIEKGTSKRFGWHNLRHSLATFLSGSVDPAVTMKVLRHKRLATTMEIYTHRVNNQQQAAQGLFLAAIGKMTPATEAIQ
jgi:integrase